MNGTRLILLGKPHSGINIRVRLSLSVASVSTPSALSHTLDFSYCTALPGFLIYTLPLGTCHHLWDTWLTACLTVCQALPCSQNSDCVHDMEWVPLQLQKIAWPKQFKATFLSFVNNLFRVGLWLFYLWHWPSQATSEKISLLSSTRMRCKVLSFPFCYLILLHRGRKKPPVTSHRAGKIF